MSRINIGIPFFPGSNGRRDMIRRIEEAGMIPHEIYFHIGHRDLKENARVISQMDGLVLPGGFPYEDRLGFGKVPCAIDEYATSLRDFIGSGKPVLGVCAGNQGLHELGAVFPEGLKKSTLNPNISDRNGEIVSSGFFNRSVWLKLSQDPSANAFTREFKEGDIFPSIVSHGGGRLDIPFETLRCVLLEGLVMTRYCNQRGEVIDDFPINPNGSVMGIDGLSNLHGNVFTGMAHHERVLNSLKRGVANGVFVSMREYIEDRCPDLSSYRTPQDFPTTKPFDYLKKELDSFRTLEVRIEMLTDDNDLNTARLLIGGEDSDFTRRRVIQIEVKDDQLPPEEIIERVSGVDVLDGIMLKKDLPYVTLSDGRTLRYALNSEEVREFEIVQSPALGYDVEFSRIPEVNIGGYLLRKQLSIDPVLATNITGIKTGDAWYFNSAEQRDRVVKRLGL